ncbi:hypothetical protein DITRI_Ditri11bG0039700 [Diplodiscus trichospermus]
MMAASAETSGGDQTVDVELIVLGNSKSAADGGSTASASDEITPLLTQSERPKVNIFSVSHSRRKPREQVIKVPETDISSISQWVWNGSRYSGLVCMALSSTIYFVMEVLSNNFTVQSIPLLETAFTRCTVSLILSYLWLRRSGQPIFGATYPRNLLVLRALVGYVSLLSFIYCIQRIPLSQGIVLNFTTPIMASIMARIILHEKLKIAEMGGLACSFFGVLFIFQQMLTTQGTENGNLKLRKQAVLIGLFSSITGGISYCLIKAAAKASDQPVLTVFSFGILASPAAAICTFAFEEFVLPSFYSLSLMIALGILSFLAEVFLTRGLQLEKISKVENVQFIEAALSQLWGIGTSRIAPSFGRLVGCLLILISVSCTVYFGPQKEIE